MAPIRWVVFVLLGMGCGPWRSGECPDNSLCPAPPRETGDVDSGTDMMSPVAICEVNHAEQSLPDALFTFDGAASFSRMGGEIIGFEWSVLEQPEDSFATLSSMTGQTTVLEGDAVGPYDVQLNVIDSLGTRSEEPCVIRVHVIDDN
ncbi:MAG: hypothetical protein ACJATT_001554 [Myxococcota bacterium]